MRTFERKTIVQAFRLPFWGNSADETPPNWLVSRIQSGDLVINSLGGFTMVNRWGHQKCSAGDVVVLTKEGAIEFATPEEFEEFEPLSNELLHAA